jgi:hypothetical protein
MFEKNEIFFKGRNSTAEFQFLSSLIKKYLYHGYIKQCQIVIQSNTVNCVTDKGKKCKLLCSVANVH